MRKLLSRLLQSVLLCAGPLAAAAPSLPKGAEATAPYNVMGREIFKELIEINTTDTELGNVTLAAEAMAKRLREAGFPPEDVKVLGPSERKKNMVARLRGTGKQKPILLIGHLDVVEAKPEDWTTNPFEFIEKDGYFYGRGTQDMKDGDAIMTTALIRLKKEGYRPSRDLIVALTADEEGGTANGVDWLFKNHRELVDADFVLNHDTASITSQNGKAFIYRLESSEKVYADFVLTATNRGGHSSLPERENAIYELASGLENLARYRFAFELTTITRAYYENMAKIETGQRAADMLAITKAPPDTAAVERLSNDSIDNALMRTTCVATRLSGGHANNALPQRAQANVNCRILPGHSPEEVRQDIIRVLANPKITVQAIDDDGQIVERASDRKGFPPPPLRPAVMEPLQKLVAEFWPGLRVVPAMSPGASDDVFVNAAGLTSYAVTGVAIDRDDHRAHGQDERLPVQSFYTGNEFYYRYLKAITAR